MNLSIQINELKNLKIRIDNLIEETKNLKIYQPDDGYRFSVDSLILVDDILPEKCEKILDIGTGCGIIPLLLARKYPNIHITAVEIQKELAEIAIQNIESNGLEKRIRLINRDIRYLNYSDTDGKFNRVVSNPPYKKKGTGRLNPDIQKAIARHEITLTLDELIFCAARFLKLNGILNIVYPFSRLKELLNTINNQSIIPEIIKPVFTALKDISPNRIAEPKLIVVQGRKS